MPSTVLLSRARRGFAAFLAVFVVGGMVPVFAVAPAPASAAPAGGGANLDQCANGSSGTTVCTASAWQNGNLNQNKAHWYEGDSVPYRLTMSSVPTGTTSTVVVEWDTTQQGKHALDYVTTFDRSAPNANPCSGIAGCNLAGASTAAIPLDPHLPADPTFHGTQVPGRFTLYGGTITSVSGYTLSGTYAGNSATSIAITFRASTATPVLAWGGHISTQFDWGPGRSAISINGSPYHTRLISLNGQGGNQDRSLHTAAVVQPGAIVVQKHTLGGDGTFSFDGTALAGAPLALTTVNGDAQSERVVVPPTTSGYTLTEAVPARGWDLRDVRCDNPVAGNASTTSGPTATVRVDAGETVTCTFTNVAHGSVSVTKRTAGGDGAFDFSLSGYGTATVTTTGGSGSASFADVAPGTVTLTEAAGTHWQYGSTVCVANGQPLATSAVTGGVSFTVAPGAAVACTVANTKLASLTVVKHTVGGDGTFDFSVTGRAPRPVTTNAGTGRTAWADLEPGSYTVAETVPQGWDLTGLTCATATGAPVPFTAAPDGAALSLAPGADVTCTFTDTARGSVTVAKTAVGGDGDFPFTLTGQPAQTITTADGGGVRSWDDVVPGAYTLTELVPAGWDLTSVRCTNGSEALATTPTADGVAFNLPAGASVLCSVTDTARATVTVVKEADGGDGTFSFALTGRATQSVTTSNGTGRTSWPDVVPGAVDLTESVPDGWDLGSVACVDATGPLATQAITDGVHFTVAPGADVTCTFADTARGSVTVVKQTVGGDGDFAFSLTGRPSAVVTTHDNAGSHSWTDVTPGSYTLAEAVPAGWDLDGVACTSGGRALATTASGSGVTFTLAPGTDVTCTFVDVARGAVTVVNHTSPATSAAFDFTFDGSPFALTGGGTTTFAATPRGLHTVGTTVPAGWSLQQATCDAGTLATSTDSVSFDLPAGGHVTCTFDLVQLASVTVVKHAVGGDGAFSFSVTGGDDHTITTVAGAGDATWDALEPGAYTVTEAATPGWDTTAVACDAPAERNGASATLELTPGQHVTCTFTNERHGSVTVVKHTVGGDGTFPFALAGRDGADVTTVDGAGRATWDGVPAGPTSLAESVPDGWRLDGASCTDATGAPVVTDATTAGVTFTLAAGADVTCTFTDTKLADVTVVKHTLGGDGTFDFALTGLGTKTVATVDGAGTTAWDAVAPGDYDLTETVPAGWDLGAVSCTSDGGDLPTGPLADGVQFTATAGAHVVCTFTDAARGSIRVLQYTDPVTSDDVDLTFDGTPFTLAGDGGTYLFGNLRARSYEIAEQVPDGWQLASVDCGDQPIVRSGTAITVDLAPGASLECSFSLVQATQASIGLTEIVDGSPARPGDTVFYVFTITNTGQSALTNVALSDDLLGTIALDVTDLAPGESVEVAVPYNVPADAPVGQAVLDTATATGTPPVGNDVTATAHGHLDVQDTVIGET